MMTSFHRALVSGVLLLAVTATITLVQSAGGSSFSIDIGQLCETEYTECFTDHTCADCSSSDRPGAAVFDACAEDVTADSVDTSTSFCLDLMAGVCCLSEASGNECLQNHPFVAYWLCLRRSLGCSEDELACDDGISFVSSSGYNVTANRASTAAITCALLMTFHPLLKM